ncbi:hypothetical protein BH11PSE2_BH11PSE2_10630 [soil metagenome]
MSLITDWTEEKAKAFTHETLTVQHSLHERPMFDDAGLASLLDRYPRDKLGVFTMGHDPVDWTTWEHGQAGDLSGAELLEAVRRGRIWLNLRKTNDYLDDYAALEAEIFGELAAKAPRTRTMKHDLGMLISSANAHVFYHLDVPLVMLWQLRGVKTVYVYPVADPYIGDEQLERIVLKETEEQFAFDLAWDAGAEVVELTPGKMVTWAQNAPHRVVNADVLNVSLSIEFMTPEALVRANVIYANGVLRRRLGTRPRIQRAFSATALGKVALARGVKKLGLAKAYQNVHPKTFMLDKTELGRLVPR